MHSLTTILAVTLDGVIPVESRLILIGSIVGFIVGIVLGYVLTAMEADADPWLREGDNAVGLIIIPCIIVPAEGTTSVAMQSLKRETKRVIRVTTWQ